MQQIRTKSPAVANVGRPYCRRMI